LKNNGLPGTWVLEALGRGDVNISELMDKIPEIIDKTLKSPELLLPDEVNYLLLLSAESSKNVDFGLEMLKLVDISMFGTYGYLLSSARTVGEFFELAVKYYSIFYQGSELSLDIRGDYFSVEYTVESPPQVNPRHDNEWTLGFFCNFLQSRLGEQINPTSITFTHAPPTNLNKLKEIFGPLICFQQTSNIMYFEKAFLKKSLSDSDPALLKIVLQQAELALNRVIAESSLESEVRLLILESLENRTANAENIAKQLNLSLSTFKRKLSTEKLDFRQIRDVVRNNLAKKLLKASQCNMNQIAFNTGFSDQSAFSRFFIRVNQITPIKYRIQHQALPNSINQNIPRR